MPVTLVSTEKVKAARVSLQVLGRRKRPSIRTEHYATFLEHASEIDRLLRRGAVWQEIQQRYYGKLENPPTIRSLQRYYVAAKKDKKRGGA